MQTRPRPVHRRIVQALASVLPAVFACAGTEATRAPRANLDHEVTVGLRRLTTAQYRKTLSDLFGPGILVPVLEDDPRVGGFSTVGAAQVGTSFYGVERYEVAARALARQILADPGRRRALVPCDLTSGGGCLREALERLAERAYRRPLDAVEVDRLIKLATTSHLADRWAGIEDAVAVILQSPKFLYRTETVARSDRSPTPRYSGRTVAARLSFFLWGTAPDAAMAAAAARGELDDDAGVLHHARRLLNAPRARAGARAFFDEHFRLDALDHLTRNRKAFPLMSDSLAGAMKEELLRILDNNLFETRRDFRTLVTGRGTFVNAELAQLYAVADELPDFAWEAGFFPLELPLASGRRGLLGTAAFLAATSHPDETSPTARGKYVREVILCDEVPPPPDDADTSLPPSPPDRPLSVRERLEDHRLDVGCARCHRKLDPLGLAFERYDPLGQRRADDRGRAIDESGELDGRDFVDLDGLTELLGADPRVPSCLMRSLYRYATGRIESAGEASILADLGARFRAGGYVVHDLILAIATSRGFLSHFPTRGSP